MNPLTFALMLLLQRADEALRLERQRTVPDITAVSRLTRRRTQLARRLRRSRPAQALAWS